MSPQRTLFSSQIKHLDSYSMSMQAKNIREVIFLKDKDIYNLGKINEQIANALKAKNDVSG